MGNSKTIIGTICAITICMTVLQGCERSVGTEVDSGSITVTLAASSPEDYTVPRNMNDVLFATFKFSAQEEDFTLPMITLTRDGLGSPSDFEGIRLEADGTELTPTLLFDPSTNKVTFDLAGTHVWVPQGGSFTVQVRANLYAAEGSKNRICITSSNDVVAIGRSSGMQVEAQGAWPVCGNFVTTQGFEPELIEYRETYFGGDIAIGDTEIDMLRVRFYNNGTRTAYVRQLNFNVATPPWHFENPTLLKSGVVIGDETNRIDDNNDVIYDLSTNPLVIPPGESISVNFRLDLLEGLCTRFGVRFHHSDSVVVEESSEEMVLVGGPESDPYTERLVIGEGIEFGAYSNTPTTTTVAQGADDHVFAEILVHAGHLSTIEGFQVNVLMDEGAENYFADLKGWMQDEDGEWFPVAGPFNPPNAVCIAGMCTYTFTDEFDVQQCGDPLIRFTMDVDPATPVGTTCAVQFLPHSVQAHISSSNEPILSEYIFGNNTITGNVQTVVAQ